MAICTFLGHRDTPNDLKTILEKEIINLVENENVDVFYVGKEGNFDYIVRETLKEIKTKYAWIEYYVILAYYPGNKEQEYYFSGHETIYPEGMEYVPMKFAINKRNLWMIEKSDFVISYVSHGFGGAAKFKRIAEKNNKKVINLYDLYKLNLPTKSDIITK